MTRLLLTLAAFGAISSAALGDGGFDAQPIRPTTHDRQPTTDDAPRLGLIELRDEASVNDANVTLRQVCRWSSADEATFSPFAELIVARLGAHGSATLTLDTLRSTLRDAGLPASRVNFRGATRCAIDRADAPPEDERAALLAWHGGADKPASAAPTAGAEPQAAVAPQNADDLRSKLVADVAQRLNLPIDSLQIDFKADDRRVLSLAAPFEFSIVPQRSGDLGETSWLVTIGGADRPAASSEVGDGRRVRIVAQARAWMEQLVVARPVSQRDALDASMVETRRVLADKLPTDAWASRAQIAGQQASRDLKPGGVLTLKCLEPIELVRPNQLVTVLSRRGAIEVKSVARAMQSGTMGQSIRVKNETTNETYEVVMTGKQTARSGGDTPSVAEAR